MSGTLDPPVGAADHVLGPPDAPLELVMYGDFECPYCRGAQGIVSRVRERLGDELRFVYRHFPIAQKHPHAHHAAEASEAAAAQGAFWPMHDALYAADAGLADADLVAHAAALGLDAARVERELRDGAYVARVDHDLQSGLRSGVAGTPSFFVGGRLHEDVFDAGSLVEALLAARA